ncbi:MAG TPA: hypothetical protein GX708_09805 [Gallicola sp.]|nr:hypothetical protein [Gallicola sp.]
MEKEKKIDNLELYNKVKEVPITAKKTIGAGRLKGYTDINPMYRIKTLTEQFGICGIGWKAPIKNKEIIEGANSEKIAIVDIELFVKVNGEWSEPIDGTGGSSFIAKESKGLYTNDECFKMAYTDALSVACKSLGIGADVYWEKDRTKYDNQKDENQPTKSAKNATVENVSPATKTQIETITKLAGERLKAVLDFEKITLETLDVVKASEIIKKLKGENK